MNAARIVDHIIIFLSVCVFRGKIFLEKSLIEKLLSFRLKESSYRFDLNIEISLKGKALIFYSENNNKKESKKSKSNMK